MEMLCGQLVVVDAHHHIEDLARTRTYSKYILFICICTCVCIYIYVCVCIYMEMVLGQLVVVDAHHHIENLDTLIRGGVALEKGALAIEECVFCYGGVPESLHQR